MKKLEIGKRYWLDRVCDVSGVFMGENEAGRFEFKDIEGKNIYILEDGIVRFSSNSTDGYKEILT